MKAHQYAKGQSGNPKGRPKGARNYATMMVEEMLKGSAQKIVSALIAKAEEGDVAAQMFIVKRLCPTRRGYPLQLSLPPINQASDLAKALAVVAAQMSAGRLTTEEAAQAVSVLAEHRKALEANDLQEQLEELELFRERVQQQRRRWRD
jgi:hypothetical protein